MNSRLFAGAVLAIVLGLAGPPSSRAQTSAETFRVLQLFGDVFEQVKDRYVEDVSEEALIEAAINGMLISLDPHSSYLDRASFEDMQVDTRGEFGGLGIDVTMENGYVKVVAPIFDTPAERAGLRPGDYITHLDGDPVRGLTLDQAVDRMRGDVDDPITLTVVREGESAPFDVELIRAVIRIQSVRFRAEGDIGYIHVVTFNEQTDIGLRRAILAIGKEVADLKGYVLDLRSNPGGLLDQAIAVSDAFLEKGEIVSTRSRVPEDAQRVNARPGDLADGLPMVVLINDGSASASEIVAGALQDHRRAVIMGTRSFGKGSVQTILPLSGDVALRLTTARYYTPSGRSIQEVGIVPDIIVPRARVENLENGERFSETDLSGALENEDRATGDTIEESDRRWRETNDLVDRDYQLSRALDLIRGIALYARDADTE